jgi:hypothetical protein
VFEHIEWGRAMSEWDLRVQIMRNWCEQNREGFLDRMFGRPSEVFIGRMLDEARRVLALTTDILPEIARISGSDDSRKIASPGAV